MTLNFHVLRELRDLRDLIFDAEYQGAWVRFTASLYTCDYGIVHVAKFDFASYITL